MSLKIGLECRDANGNITCSPETLTTYTLGTHHVAKRTNGSITITEAIGKNIWWAISQYDTMPYCDGLHSESMGYAMPYFDFNNETGVLSWTWREALNSARMACATSGESGFDIIYGVW